MDRGHHDRLGDRFRRARGHWPRGVHPAPAGDVGVPPPMSGGVVLVVAASTAKRAPRAAGDGPVPASGITSGSLIQQVAGMWRGDDERKWGRREYRRPGREAPEAGDGTPAVDTTDRPCTRCFRGQLRWNRSAAVGCGSDGLARVVEQPAGARPRFSVPGSRHTAQRLWTSARDAQCALSVADVRRNR